MCGAYEHTFGSAAMGHPANIDAVYLLHVETVAQAA